MSQEIIPEVLPTVIFQISDTQIQPIINPLRAKIVRGNINIYLHFMSFLHIGLTQQVLQIVPQLREGPVR